MTPEQYLKHAIILRGIEIYHIDGFDASNITAENIDDKWNELEEIDEDAIQDGKNEIRCSGTETGLKCEYSRHYESDAVAAQMPDGTWVGWTYWHGGGKHGEPEAMDWMSDSYFLYCKEEEKVVTVRTFTRIEAANAQ